MIVTRRRKLKDNEVPLPLHMNGVTIPVKDRVKYLGVVVQNNLKFNHHCEKVLQSAKNTWKNLWQFVGPRSPLSNINKIVIYKTYVRPILTYNIHIWGPLTSKTNLKKIQAFQNKCLRLALGLRPDPMTHRQVRNEVVHQIAGIPTIEEFMNRLKNKFYWKSTSHPNPLIARLSSLNQFA